MVFFCVLIGYDCVRNTVKACDKDAGGLIFTGNCVCDVT